MSRSLTRLVCPSPILEYLKYLELLLDGGLWKWRYLQNHGFNAEICSDLEYVGYPHFGNLDIVGPELKPSLLRLTPSQLNSWRIHPPVPSGPASCCGSLGEQRPQRHGGGRGGSSIVGMLVTSWIIFDDIQCKYIGIIILKWSLTLRLREIRGVISVVPGHSASLTWPCLVSWCCQTRTVWSIRAPSCSIQSMLTSARSKCLQIVPRHCELISCCILADKCTGLVAFNAFYAGHISFTVHHSRKQFV